MSDSESDQDLDEIDNPDVTTDHRECHQGS